MVDRWQQARALQERLVEHRRHLHRHPEVGLELPRTHDYIASALSDLGLAPEAHPGAGVSTVVKGREADAPTVILRADLDALPVAEETGLAYAASGDAMHACGHDLHAAMLLGAAEALTQQPGRGDTVLVFQPGEEADRGAVPTLAAHRNLQVNDAETFAIHVHATLPSGTVNHRRGTFMAAGDWFRVAFSGPGTHASQPHLAGNPVAAGAEFVTRLNAAVEDLAATEPLVATVTEFLMGNAVNVIATNGSLRGTIRTLSPAIRTALIDQIHRIANEAAAHRELSARVEVTEGYPPTVCDPSYTNRLAQALESSPARQQPMSAASMVIEDYAYFLQRWPGAMVYLGAQVEGHEAFNHSARAVFDEGVLSTGAALHLLAADGLTSENP